MRAFRQAAVYAEGRGIITADLAFDGRIRAIGEVGEADVLPLPAGAVVLPAFIDEHIHGAGGADAMDGTHASIGTIAKTLAAEGTGAFLATTMTQSPENITRALQAAGEYYSHPSAGGARLLGVHLEGPFISARHKGAQPLEYVAKPSVSVFEEYQRAADVSASSRWLPKRKGRWRSSGI